MKIRLLLLALALSAILPPVEGSGRNQSAPELSGPLDPADADHLLLVGFEDRSINRPSIVTSASSYRRRGQYQSSTWSKRISEQIAEDYHLQKMAEWPMTEVGIHCVVYRIQSLDAMPRALQQMAKDDRISVVQKMHLFETRSDPPGDPYFKLQSNMKLMQIDDVHAQTTGNNVTIGMIDTGVDLNHPDLSGQIARNENFAEKISPSFDTDKHGTAVAGIMVAKKNNGTGIVGVAPNARLVALKACWPDRKESISSVCNSYTLALAVNTAIKSGVKILNMSLSGPRDPLLEILLNKAIEKGIVVVAADSGSGSEDGNFPASLKNVIPVQSSEQARTRDSPANRPVAAPGEKILTTLPYGTYDFISGSSMASAEVSGIIALMLEIRPELELDEIKTLLRRSGLPDKLGAFSGINAYHAVLDLCKTADCPEKKENLSFAWQNF